MAKKTSYLPQFIQGTLILAGFFLAIGAIRPFVSLLRRFQQVLPTTLKTTDYRTNFLILGEGGAGHEAPDLTDTIIFISYYHPTGQVIMLSLPRDIWLDSLQAKLNTAYYYGNQRTPNGGLVLAPAVVEEIIAQPIHYIAVLDFSAFTQAIDLLGGIAIDVPKSFDDYQYPIPGNENAYPLADRYEHLHFDQGLQTMNGTTALKYVRSRNATGDEGTDYARAARQQQVILAFQNKLLSQKILTRPQILTALLKLGTNSVNTNIPTDAIPALIKLALKFDRSQITIVTIDQGNPDDPNDGLLVNPPPSQYNGQWVLTGRDQSWTEIRNYVEKLIQDTSL